MPSYTGPNAPKYPNPDEAARRRELEEIHPEFAPQPAKEIPAAQPEEPADPPEDDIPEQGSLLTAHEHLAHIKAGLEEAIKRHPSWQEPIGHGDAYKGATVRYLNSRGYLKQFGPRGRRN